MRADKGKRKLRTESCPFCGKQGLALVKIHLKSCSHPSNKEFSASYVAKHSEASASKPGRSWTKAQRIAHMHIMQKTVRENPDSYRGRFFRGYSPVVIDGVNYDSRWEFKVCQYFDAQGITYRRDCPGFPYTHKGVERTYFPDFYLPGLKMYVEVKGLATTRDLSKWLGFKHKLVVLSHTSIKHITSGGRFDFISAAAHRKKFIVDNKPYSRRQLKNLKVSEFDGISLKKPLSAKERAESRKRGAEKFKQSAYVLRLKEEAAERKILRDKTLDTRYTGSRNSQTGSYWITNSIENRKWDDSKGNLPKGFRLGRKMKKA